MVPKNDNSTSTSLGGNETPGVVVPPVQPVITEFWFELVTPNNGEYQYRLSEKGTGHCFRVISKNGDAIQEAINQILGILRCLEALEKL